MTKIEMVALAAYCNNWCIVVQCTNYIAKRGGYAKYLRAYTMAGANPRHIQELQKAQKEIRAFCNEFGFTPSSRGRIEPSGKVEEGEEDLD